MSCGRQEYLVEDRMRESMSKVRSAGVVGKEGGSQELWRCDSGSLAPSLGRSGSAPIAQNVAAAGLASAWSVTSPSAGRTQCVS